MENICRFCFNADVYNSLPISDNDYFDNGLDDSNDMCSITIGNCSSKTQMYLNSGNGEAVHIEVCRWREKGYRGQDGYVTIGKYYPKYCPECGRQLKEYNIDEKGTTYKRVERK